MPAMTEKSIYAPPPLTIGDVTVPVPIIQGGMGVGVSMGGLASAVARAGGIGVIASVLIGMIKADFHKGPQGATFRALKEQIHLAKEAVPNGIIGVNIMVALNDYEEIARIAAKAGADLIISGAGLPLRHTSELQSQLSLQIEQPGLSVADGIYISPIFLMPSLLKALWQEATSASKQKI